MSIKIALAGNPNCGKTTLFNNLTGSNQYVGNWPGVTVEKKEGKLKGEKDVIIQDLPGIYSLSPYTLEEVVSRTYLVKEKPDAILNIIDGTNIERNLYLTTQLIELGIPVVMAVNMIDLVRKNGDKIDLKKLSAELGCQAVEISALKGEGTEAAAKAAVAGQCGALADIIGHHAGQGAEGHVDAGVQCLVQNVGDEHVGQTQAVVDVAHIDKAKDAQHCHGEGEGADPRDELTALGGLAGVHDRADDGVIHGVPDLGDQQQDTHVEGVDLQDQGVEDRQIHGAVLLGEAAAQIAQRIADLVLHGEGSDGLFLVHCILSSLKTVKPRDFSHKSLFYACIIR